MTSLFTKQLSAAAAFGWMLTFASFAPVAQAAVISDSTYEWTDDGSEMDQTGRLFRDSVKSVWGSVKPTPALFDSTAQDAVEFVFSSGLFNMIQVTIEQLTQHNVYAASYDVYNAASPTSGYLADAGRSSGVPPTVYSYQFDYATGTNFSVVLSTTNGVSSAELARTRILVEGFNSQSSTVPEPGSMALLGLGLAGIGFARRKR
jgi:hypothetical protein